MAQAQLEPALTAFEHAVSLYTQLGESPGQIRSQLNQAQVLRALGFYRRSLSILTTVNQTLTSQPSSHVKASGLRQLGHTLRLVGELDQSQDVLQQSLKIATALDSPTDISITWLSLGATAEAQQNPTAALNSYAQAVTVAVNPTIQLQALVNQFDLAVKSQQWLLAQKLQAQIQRQLPQVTPSRTSVLIQLAFAKTLLTAEQNRSQRTEAANPHLVLMPFQEIRQLLLTTVRQARNLGDIRAESYALGNLGTLNEAMDQPQNALKATQTALRLAQSIKATDILYQWQWQLGRLNDALATAAQTQVTLATTEVERQQAHATYARNQDAAIAAYDAAIQTLKQVRADLLPIHTDLQFNFRDDVEPVYRQFVDVLLRTDTAAQSGPENPLEKVLDTIDALQLSELEDFLRCNLALAPTAPVEQAIDTVDPNAVFIYPIVLDQRLEIMVKLPGELLTHRSIAVSHKEVESVIEALRSHLQQAQFTEEVKVSARQLYDWLITPIATDLERLNQDHKAHTLVFVLDSDLQNIPMGVLYKEGQYLIEQYAIAVVPNRQLFDPRPRNSQLKVLTAGVSAAQTVDNLSFEPLPFVEKELATVQQISQTKQAPLLNQKFTEDRLQQNVDSARFPNVHIATHGEFSSDPHQTYLLAWGQRLNLFDLEQVLQVGEGDSTKTIELLVLSACKTAQGNRRAALGLAGVAAQANVRTTVATLWQVKDATTAELMARFYQELNQGQSIAAALRQAQLMLLEDLDTRLPYFWAPFVIVGNWT